MCQTANLLVEGRGALRQAADLFGHHGKPASGVTSACRFDRRVQRQQVGLIGDGLDVFQQLEDRIQLLAHLINLTQRGRTALAFFLQQGHQLLDQGAGPHRELADIDPGVIGGLSNQAADRILLAPRCLADCTEAAAQFGDGFAHQAVDTLDLGAHFQHFVLGRYAQLVEQGLVLLQRLLVILDRMHPLPDHPASPTQHEQQAGGRPPEQHGRGTRQGGDDMSNREAGQCEQNLDIRGGHSRSPVLRELLV